MIISMSGVRHFFEWIGIKEHLDERDIRPPYFKEGELWWAHVGENVGSEVNGKGKTFTRPVVVLRKLSVHTFLAVPTSTKAKIGTWYIPFYHKGVPEVALLAQIRVLSFKRLKEKIGELNPEDLNVIRIGFRNLYY